MILIAIVIVIVIVLVIGIIIAKAVEIVIPIYRIYETYHLSSLVSL